MTRDLWVQLCQATLHFCYKQEQETPKWGRRCPFSDTIEGGGLQCCETYQGWGVPHRPINLLATASVNCRTIDVLTPLSPHSATLSRWGAGTGRSRSVLTHPVKTVYGQFWLCLEFVHSGTHADLFSIRGREESSNSMHSTLQLLALKLHLA